MNNYATLRAGLLAWYDHAKRDLPWRRTRDPWAILVSEVMLQQTRVDTAIEYYKKFLKLFPTPAALANAPVDAVLAAWAGLGYYRRARMLHAAARDIKNLHGGRVPPDYLQLRALPGIGEYTAGAISSIAFGARVAAVDGNVIRVLSRIAALEGDSMTGARRREIATIATDLVAGVDRPGDWTQALMELGATVCTPTAPLCLLCPVSSECAARRRGLVARIPPPRKRRAQESVSHAAAVVKRGDSYLFVKRDENALNGGLYEFPTTEISDGMETSDALVSFVKERTGISVDVKATVARVRHSITFRRIDVDARAAAARGGSPVPGASWLAIADARERGVTAATRKILTAIETIPDNSNPSGIVKSQKTVGDAKVKKTRKATNREKTNRK